MAKKHLFRRLQTKVDKKMTKNELFLAIPVKGGGDVEELFGEGGVTAQHPLTILQDEI